MGGAANTGVQLSMSSGNIGSSPSWSVDGSYANFGASASKSGGSVTAGYGVGARASANLNVNLPTVVVLCPEMKKNEANMQNPSSWRELYLLEIIVVAMFLLFIPVFVVASRWLGSHSPFLICLIWGAIWLRLGYALANWKCPNCSSRFLTNEKSTVTVPFRVHCANCGIRRGSSVPSNGTSHNLNNPYRSGPK
jgi:hypothetical protein